MKLPIAAGLATAAVSITLYPLFSGGTWLWAGVGAIIVITAGSVITSRNSVPEWIGPPLGFFLLLVYLTAVFAGEKAWVIVVPTKDSVMELGHLIVQGFGDIQRYAAPVPSNAGITLLTTGGIGLIALLVDLLAVRLRRAALAGLPLLALFTVPAAVLTDPIGWPAFIIGALGYVGLLVADGRERLSHWGRAVLVRRSRAAGGRVQSDAAPLSLTGKRIGFAAIAIAIGLPALLPTLQPNPLFGFGVGSGNGRGGNTITIPNPIANLRGQLSQPDNAVVLTYTDSDNVPRYLRVYSLEIFDGDQWTMSKPEGKVENRVSEGPLPPPPGLSAGIPVNKVSARISISDAVENRSTLDSFLPLPYPSSTVRIDGDWRADESTLMVFSTRDKVGGATYDVEVLDPQPTADELRNLPPSVSPSNSRYLQLPPNLPPQIRTISTRLVKDTDTPYQKAVKLQQWFTTKGGFTYSLRTQGNGNDALMDFLRNRTGYCEQFAAAMAVMARVLGIPARVGIGYTGGTNVGDHWEVRTHDLHAWPELYFEGVGWLRFEPTPSGSLGQATASAPEYSIPQSSSDSGGGETVTSPTSDPSVDDPDDQLTPRARNPRDPDAGLAVDPVVVDQGLPVPAKIGLGVVVVLLLTLIPAAWRALTWYRRRRVWAGLAAADARGGSGSAQKRDPGRRREAGPEGASAARTRAEAGSGSGSGGETQGFAAGRLGAAVDATWRELIDTLYDLGLDHQVSESPRALARRLIEQYELDTESAASIARMASAEERLRYARTPGPITSLADDVSRLRRALRATVSRGRRLRATLLPPSTLRRVRGVGEKVLDGFDRLENFRPWPRRRDADADAAETASQDRVLTGSRSG